jgi:hypothetical protein
VQSRLLPEVVAAQEGTAKEQVGRAEGEAFVGRQPQEARRLQRRRQARDRGLGNAAAIGQFLVGQRHAGIRQHAQQSQAAAQGADFVAGCGIACKHLIPPIFRNAVPFQPEDR